MKQYILGLSLGAAATATIFGVWAVLGQNPGTLDNAQEMTTALISTVRLYQLAGISGLFSIASFFVGMVYPAKQLIQNADGSVTKIAV